MSIKKWEYMTLYVGRSGGGSTHSSSSFESDLNILGEQGWEFVGRGMNNGKIHNDLVFKREKK